MRYSLLLGLVFLPFLSCMDEGSPLLPNAPYERWKTYGYHNYTIDQRRVCFCPDAGAAVCLTIQADTIARVMNITDNNEVPYPSRQYYLTIDSLFGLIRYSTSDSLVVQYNPQYGYPEKLDINPQLHPVDGGVLYETSNLRTP
jgi:hypothetical protein